MIPRRIRSIGLKQARGDNECIPTVAAMAVGDFVTKQAEGELMPVFEKRLGVIGRSLKKKRTEFKAMFPQHPGGGWLDTDMMLWLLMHDLCMGVGYNKASQVTVQADKQSVHIGPAYIVVDSETRGGGKPHSLYWDGIKIWDPNPQSEDLRPHTSYDIQGWYPIYPTVVNATIVKKRVADEPPKEAAAGDEEDPQAAAE